MAVIITKNVLRQYQSKSATREVLGCLVNNPSLLLTHKITADDFVESFYKIIFGAIKNCYANKATKLDAYVIEEYLKEAFPTKFEIFKRNEGLRYIQKASEMAIEANFESNYMELKKFSLLRALLQSGEDVSDFFDPEETDADELDAKREMFESNSLDDIINYFKNKLVTVSMQYSLKNGRDSVKAGSAEAKLQKEKWKKDIPFGLSYASQFFNTVTYGLRKKRFTLGSADSGTGKTRLSIANLCFSFVPKFYNSTTGEWETNPHGTQNAGLYIGTEMELIEEIEPILWAYIADVPEDHILFGNYQPGEEERVDEAIRILNEEANIYLEYVPDYDIGTLEKIIDEHVVKHNVGHVFFDYIHTTTELISEFQTEAKARMNTREDQVLNNLGVKIKELTRKYNISIDTWTQVTGDVRNEQVRDSSLIRGAKGLKDKADTCFIVTRPTKKEMKLLEKVLKSKTMFGKPDPNICYSVYKNRGGKLNNVKIWLYINYDTMRVHDLFVTDYDYNLLPVDKTYVGVNEDQKIIISKDSKALKSELIKAKIEMNAIEDDGEIIDIEEDFADVEDSGNNNQKNVENEPQKSRKNVSEDTQTPSKNVSESAESRSKNVEQIKQSYHEKATETELDSTDIEQEKINKRVSHILQDDPDFNF